MNSAAAISGTYRVFFSVDRTGIATAALKVLLPEIQAKLERYWKPSSVCTPPQYS
ncbi:hypothetical protein [Paraburkholderia sp. JPY419]|uniref:hypothetical protein n=1 Tax=Paraburkholderia sp. JPY419 TaxID=667660 RepID=UPI003D23DBBF